MRQCITFTAGQIMNWLIMSTTYLFFRRAMKAQGKGPDNLPYTSKLLPYGAYCECSS